MDIGARGDCIYISNKSNKFSLSKKFSIMFLLGYYNYCFRLIEPLNNKDKTLRELKLFVSKNLPFKIKVKNLLNLFFLIKKILTKQFFNYKMI